jgi:nitrate reductase NapE component
MNEPYYKYPSHNRDKDSDGITVSDCLFPLLMIAVVGGIILAIVA